ncbi:transposase [candidate division KSB1 bacterium]|nr:transposase [candidate division KSB1 bacterium]
MPTHFHSLVFITYEKIELIKSRIGVWLSSYTKAINKKFDRHGSLFQHHTKAKHIDDDSYIVTLLTYIHQNPVRSNLVKEAEDWEFSSYRDYIGIGNGTLPNKTLVKRMFASVEELKQFTEMSIQKIDEKYGCEKMDSTSKVESI